MTQEKSVQNIAIDASSMKHCCRICGNILSNKLFSAREMMFGSREMFEYFECALCGCLQITDIPKNLGKYYPTQYYSFQPPSRLKVLIKGAWLCDPFTLKTLFKRLLTFFPGIKLMPLWIKRARLKKDASILEIGSGNGSRLVAMRQLGHKNLIGIDPFIQEDVKYFDDIQILKKEIKDVTSSYDFVMLHHAFEHMPEQLKTLHEIGRILKKDGTVLIRIPVASSYAWKTYGVHWYGLDPPRHLYIHTPRSLQLIADQAGFDIVDTFFDGDIAQFVASEQYMKDIPLRDPRSYTENKYKSIFSHTQLRAFKKQVKPLNDEMLGDSAAFYLRKKH